MANGEPKIKTTVVGSYPVPDWLVALPSEQALIDATRAVLSTQETAGLDVVCDGELYRFDVNHPETNGMIEYFTRPMAGIRNDNSFDEIIAYRQQTGMAFRAQPPGVVDAAIGHGTLDLPYAAMRAGLSQMRIAGRRPPSIPMRCTPVMEARIGFTRRVR